MMVSDEEKRWLVVGIAMNKVAAPVLRDFIKQGMNTHYTNMDIYCNSLATPCTLKTLTYHQVSTDPCFKHLKFQNINNNLQLYGMKKRDLPKYNYNINSSVDLAKLFLPDHLAEFSDFDDSLDMSAILRLLGFNKPAPIFHPPNPLISIQLSADDVRENVRNTWGHCNVTDWTEAFFNDCFSKLATLVRSLGLTSGMEKMVLDQLSDWETKGCQFCMGHAVDQNLLSFVQQDVKELVKRYKTTVESVAQQRVELTEMQDQQSATRAQLEDYDDQLTAVLEWKEQQMKENKEILLKLMSVEEMLTEELLIRVEEVEKGLGETDKKVKQLEQGFAKTDDKVEQLEQEFAKTDDKVEQLVQGFAKTDDKVEQLEQEFAKTDDKVEQLEQGFAETDDKVEQLEQGFAKTDDKVEQLVQGFAKTDGKVEQLEQGFAQTDGKVEQLQQGFSKTDNKVEQLQQGFAKTDDKVEQLQQGFAEVVSETGNKVKQLEEAVRSQRMKENKPGFSVQGRPPLSIEHNPLTFPACGQTSVQTSQTQSRYPQKASPVETFDVKTCQKKLAEHYQKTAKVPTTAWSSVLQVDLEQIYTRLSWMKQEQTTDGPSQKELNHYSEIFTEKTTNGVEANRILVQGETGIGKTTFVKKLLLDWSSLEEVKMDEKQKDALRKFDLVVSINLKEVSQCQTFKEVLHQSRVFPDDETSSIDDLRSYIRENQDKVLLVFDGYDEYRTGSEAEEKYGSRSNSPIYNIFHGDILRDCTVLVTTRSSRADELQECADIHAEITGFNGFDRQAFMIKFLDSKTEADGLCTFLIESTLYDLARVPLLVLFFCLLWKEEKEKLEKGLKSKAELFQEILNHILRHSHRRHSPSNASKMKEAEYNEILNEMGKVALEGLLRGDLLFKFGQLPEKVRSEESVIVGLLQISESSPSLEPKQMVSFIHKSIQEFLAAWLIAYRCVPEGNLGGIEQCACTVEDCTALENVFQFVSGLSDKGAEKVFEHLSSVRTKDISATIPDKDNQTDVPVYHLTEKHWQFSDLAFNCFQEVDSKIELLCRFLDCFGEIVPVSHHVLRSQFMPNVKDVSTSAHSRIFAFRFLEIFQDEISYKSLEEVIQCFLIPGITKSTEFRRISDFLEKFQKTNCVSVMPCSFNFILGFSTGQFEFYITDLILSCDDHARLLTETTDISVPSVSANFCSEESCLKFVRSLRCASVLSDETMKCLCAAITNCKHLGCIDVVRGDDSVCDLLENVPYPNNCTLNLGVRLTSAGAVKLSSFLPRFNNISCLNLGFVDAEVDALITSITHKSLKRLGLSGIILTPAAAAALGRSLSEMESLKRFAITVANETILQRKEMEALFGGFYKTLPLKSLTFSGFSVKGCLPVLTKSFRFFPNLEELEVGKFSMDEHILFGLLKSLSFTPNLKILDVEGERLSYEHCCKAQLNTVSTFAHANLEKLVLSNISLNPATAAALGRSLSGMSSLRILELTEMDGNMLQIEEIKALFGGSNNAVPLFPNSLCLFSNLRQLYLGMFNMNEQHLVGLLESLRFIPNLKSLYVKGRRLFVSDSSAAEVNTECSLTNVTLQDLTLEGISLTPTVAAMLGRSLPKMSSLRYLSLAALDRSVVRAEQMERLFDGFKETLPLACLHFSGFSVRGCLAPLTRSFSSFPNLEWLELNNLDMNEHDLLSLLKSLRFIPNLEALGLSGNPLGHAVTSIVPHVINLPKLRFLYLQRTGSEEDLKSVKQALRHLPTLRIDCW